jgi:hypothetical protein
MTKRFLFFEAFSLLCCSSDWPFFFNAKVFSSPASTLDFQCIALTLWVVYRMVFWSSLVYFFVSFLFLSRFFNFHTMLAAYMVGRGQGMRRRDYAKMRRLLIHDCPRHCERSSK